MEPIFQGTDDITDDFADVGSIKGFGGVGRFEEEEVGEGVYLCAFDTGGRGRPRDALEGADEGGEG